MSEPMPDPTTLPPLSEEELRRWSVHPFSGSVVIRLVAEVTRLRAREFAVRWALYDVLRWFKSYPELVPNPERYGEYRRALRDAREVLDA